MEQITILVLTTSVNSEVEIARLKPTLDQMGRWSFDLEDEDRILRLETTWPATNVTKALGQLGVCCRLLPFSS
ncbi:hypothetical protein ACFOET_03925 [Parapedobacter deserti]|uniref:Uncharacterized protein n=1 Tax=Parapedobacter deserti TaxID=1912957 RepID=A0ABV7JIS3_9SPHI